MFKIKKIIPQFNQIVTTMNMYDNDVRIGSIIDGSRTGRIKEYQTVIAVGPMVAAKGAINPGDTVFINPKRFATMGHKFGSVNEDNVQKDNMHINFNIPHYPVYCREDGSCEEQLLISDNDVAFVAEGEEFEEAPLLVGSEKPSIIIP